MFSSLRVCLALGELGMPHLSSLLKLIFFLSFSLSTYESSLATQPPRECCSVGTAVLAAQTDRLPPGPC